VPIAAIAKIAPLGNRGCLLMAVVTPLSSGLEGHLVGTLRAQASYGFGAAPEAGAVPVVPATRTRARAPPFAV